MIRLLKEKDRFEVLKYLYKDVNFNIFPIGDIETFGFDNPIQKIYGELDDEGNYLSVFLRYKDNGMFYSDDLRFNDEYLKVFDKEHFNIFNVKAALGNIIEPYLLGFKKQASYFCKASSINYDNTSKESEIIKEVKTKADCEKLYDLLIQIDEFGIGRNSKEEFVKGKLLSIQMGKTLFIEKDNKIVSTVATTAETTKNAMVVGVATDSNYRKKGYVTQLLSKLMKIYIEDKKKELCLFYDNPKAGNIYLRLGFEYIGNWNMYKRNKIVK